MKDISRVNYGIEKLTWFKIESIDENNNAIFSKTKPLAGVIKINLSPDNQRIDHTRDSVVITSKYNKPLYTGTLLLYQVASDENSNFVNHALGYNKSKNGSLYYTGNHNNFGIQYTELVKDEFGFTTENIVTLYNVSAGSFKKESNTTGTTVEYVQYEIPLTVYPSIYVKDNVTDSMVINEVTIDQNNSSLSDNVNNGDVITPNTELDETKYTLIGNLVIDIDQWS